MVARTLGGPPAGIVVRAVSCPTGMATKEGLGRERENTTEREKETETETGGGIMIERERETMIGEEIEGVIMIEIVREIMTGRERGGVIMIEEVALGGAGVEVEAGVGVGACKLIPNAMITIRTLLEMTTKRKKKIEHLCQVIWPSLRTYMVI